MTSCCGGCGNRAWSGEADPHANVVPDQVRVDARLGALLKVQPSGTARATSPPIEAGWRATSALKCEYRQSIGYATDEELRALLGKRYDKLADRVRERLQLLARQRA